MVRRRDDDRKLESYQKGLTLPVTKKRINFPISDYAEMGIFLYNSL